MISMMTDIIHEHRRATEAYTSEDLARMVLDMQEKYMLPPESTRTDPGHFRGDSFEYSIREWDDEDL